MLFIQWLGARGNTRLNTRPNRLVRTRMLGGVAGVPEQSGPLCRSIVIWRLSTRVRNQRDNLHFNPCGK